MVKCCSLKVWDSEKEFVSQPGVVLCEHASPYDIDGCFAQWDKCDEHDNGIVTLVNSFGDLLAKCPWPVFNRYFDWD